MKKRKTFCWIMILMLMAVLCTPANLSYAKTQTEDNTSSSVEKENYKKNAENAYIGKNLTWTMKDGVMTISGKGEMDTGYYDENEWTCPWIHVKKLIIKEGVTSVGSYAFWNCKELKSVQLPNSIKKIEELAFAGCSSLKSITIPKNVKKIELDSFRVCPKLKSINVSKANKNYSSLDGALYNKKQTWLMIYPGAKTTCKISAKVTRVGGDGMTSPTLSASEAFDTEGTLKSITVDKKNKKYSSQDGLLYNKKGTKLIYCPSGIKKLNIPKKVTEIGMCAGHSCIKLTSIVIPEGVKKIGESAFEGCYNLKSLKLPKSVTDMGRWVFSYSNTKCTIYVYYGSYAEEYCRGNKAVGRKFIYKVIDPANIQKAKVKLGKVYYAGGSKLDLSSVTVKYKGKTLEKNVDYKVGFSKERKAGQTVTVKITGKNAYKGSISKKVKIQKKSVTKLKVKGIPETQTYTGKQIKPKPEVYDGKQKLKEGSDYTLSYGKNTQMGKASVKITGKGGYSGSVTKNFNIGPAKPTITSITEDGDYVTVSYNKVEKASGYQITYNADFMESAESKTVDGENNSVTIMKPYNEEVEYYDLYVKVRAYTVVDSKKVYGEYSKKQKIHVKSVVWEEEL